MSLFGSKKKSVSDEVSDFESKLIAKRKAEEEAEEAKQTEIAANMDKPLHNGEKRLHEVSAGYFFTKNEGGQVFYRTFEQHRSELESRYFVEPPRAPQQQVIAKLY